MLPDELLRCLGPRLLLAWPPRDVLRGRLVPRPLALRPEDCERPPPDDRPPLETRWLC